MTEGSSTVIQGCVQLFT